MTSLQLKTLAFNLLLLIGAGVFDYGLWLAWRPLGFVFAGLELATAGFLLAYEQETLRRRR